MHREKAKYSLILISLFMASQTFAASLNDLVGIDLNQTSENSVRVNIYTDKPYKDQVIVNKKPNNQYVILLPETSATDYTAPDISNIPALKHIEIKEQQYASLPDKGYTKITIESKKPIEVIPQTYTSKKKLITANTSSNKNNEISYAASQKIPIALPQRIINQQKTPISEISAASSERKTTSDAVQNRNFNQSNTQRNENNNNTGLQNRTGNITEILPLPPNLESQSTVPPDETPTQESRATQEQLTENETADENSNQEIAENQTTSDEDITEEDLAFFKKLIRFKQKVVRKVKKILSYRISFNSFATVLQLILLGVLIKLFGDVLKKLGKDDTPLKTRLIHNQEERFEPAYPTYSDMDVYSSNQSNFEENNKDGFNIQPISTSYIEKAGNLNNSTNPTSGQNSNKFNLIDEVHDMSVFDENSKDIEKAIFKNPLTPVSKEDEDKIFDEDEIEPAQENTPFIYEQEDDKNEFLNFANEPQNESDFLIYEDDNNFDETSYQNDFETIEEVAQDDDYDLYADYEDQTVDDYIAEKNNAEEYIYVDENGEEYEEIIEDEDDYDDEQIIEDTNNADNYVKEEEPADINPFEHLKVESKYVIDSFKGFAHVSVDGINAIISYVGSQVNIIRKFKEKVDAQMQVRINEQPDAETLIYIVKLGSYKTLVEVKPDSIRPLLDL